MHELLQPLMDAFPEALLQLRDGTVLSANAAARRMLPWLTPGAPAPGYMQLPDGCEAGSGSFTEGLSTYLFSASRYEGGLLFFFRPVPQSFLTEFQMDGVLRQLRELTGELLCHAVPPAQDAARAAFSRTFHRLFRLVGNLDYVHQSASLQSLAFQPTAVNLDRLCRDLVAAARDPLSRAGVTLDYECPDRDLLIPGDPQLLQRMLLGLLSNFARAAAEGRVVVALRRQQSRALLSLSGTGPLPDQRQLTAMLQIGGGADLPLPGQGAGLGLVVVRHIVSLHQGQMLTYLERSSPAVLVSLPTEPLPARVSLHTPLPVQRDGGLSPVMVELSDLLPAELFLTEELD